MTGAPTTGVPMPRTRSGPAPVRKEVLPRPPAHRPQQLPIGAPRTECEHPLIDQRSLQSPRWRGRSVQLLLEVEDGVRRVVA